MEFFKYESDLIMTIMMGTLAFDLIVASVWGLLYLIFGDPDKNDKER